MSGHRSIRRIHPSESVPENVLDFLRSLGGPSVLRVPGRDRTRVRAVATLLHGNEPSGIRALHAWLRSGREPAVDVLCFVGAVEAALAEPAFTHRHLPGSRDLNRCFVPPFEGPEGEVARDALALFGEASPEALVDLHNNSGHNPPYGVGPDRGAAHLALVSLFADRFVHSELRLGALVEATHTEFPSVTIECGRSGDPTADVVARAGVARYLEAPQLDREADANRVSVLANPVRVRVREGVRLAFGDCLEADTDLTVRADIDRHNFEPLAAGAPIGWLGRSSRLPLEAHAADGRDVADEFFAVCDGVLQTRRGLIPIMMTTDPRSALGDCLFYAVSHDGDADS